VCESSEILLPRYFEGETNKGKVRIIMIKLKTSNLDLTLKTFTRLALLRFLLVAPGGLLSADRAKSLAGQQAEEIDPGNESVVFFTSNTVGRAQQRQRGTTAAEGSGLTSLIFDAKVIQVASRFWAGV
jgi:hypothetical protein